MQKVPYDIWDQYVAFLNAKVKDVSQHENLKKWFLYFWDFRAKYRPPDSRSEQVRSFIEKLQNKGQSQNRRPMQYRFILSLRMQRQRLRQQPRHPENHNSPYPPLILRGG